MNKAKIIGTIVLVVVVASLVGIQPGYASKHTTAPGAPGHVWALIESVSNPSASCANLGLNGGYGTVTVLPKGIGVALQHASPGSTYEVSLGYVQATGGCDGTWQSVGLVTTNAAGTGTLAQKLSMPSGHHYIVEFTDSAGNVIYATDYIPL